MGTLSPRSILAMARSVESPGLFISCRSSNVGNGFALDRSIAVLRGYEYGTAFPVPASTELVFEPEQALKGRATDRFAPGPMPSAV